MYNFFTQEESGKTLFLERATLCCERCGIVNAWFSIAGFLLRPYNTGLGYKFSYYPLFPNKGITVLPTGMDLLVP